MQRTILILAYFFVCTNSFAQQYPFVHYTPKDGLVNSRVKKAYQDSKGRMYFLTYGGLSVFDGARFRNYTTQQGLANDLVNDIIEVGDDSLLVANNSSLYLNTLVKGKIGRLKTEGDTLPVINQFYRNDQGKIFLSSDNGLFILENKKIIDLNISLLSKNSPMFPYLGDITGTGNYIVISTNDLRGHKGLYLYDIKNNTICDALPEVKAYLLGRDKGNTIWISMPDQLFILDGIALSKGKLLLTLPVHGYQQAKDYSTINIAFDKNCIWFVHRNEDYRNEDIHRIEENGSLLKIPLPEQATSSDIKNIIIDRENTIWLCNDGEGIFKILNSPLRIFQNPLGKSMQSQTDNVYYFNHVTWYSTNNYKLFRKSEKGMQQFNSNIKQSPVVFHEDADNLLAADYKNIYKATLTNKSSIYFHKVISLPDPDYFSGTLVIDNKKAILSAQKTGICIWMGEQLIFRVPVSSNDGVEKICLDKNNLVWAAKRFTGIDVFSIHPEDHSKYLQPVYHFPSEQIGGSIRSFVIDRTGLIWIGTREHGLTAYKQDGNSLHQIYHFDAGNGLSDNFVTSLACDSLNNIIAGTQTGLDRITHKETSYRIENLSKSNDFFAYVKKVWVDVQNQAYALTNTGVILQVSPPSFENEKNYTPELLLEEVKVNGQAVAKDRMNYSYKENNLNFLVAAPSFIDEKRVAFSYLLEGSGNKQWSDTTAANSVINLTNLSAGKYLLKLKAFFPSTSYTPAGLSYSFEITPPWWQTVLFRLITATLIMGLLIIGVRYYYRRKLIVQRRLLEKQQAIEKERTRIATDMHDDLGAGLSRIKFLSQSLNNKDTNDESIKTALEKITGYSDEMTEKMGEIVWALNEKNDTLADLVAYTRSYTVEYLANHNIQCKANTPLHLPVTFIPGEIRRNIFLTVKECLHNIVKHADATQVYFSVELNKEILIIIHDNGKGIDWNNQRPYSNGLQNIRKRMNEIKGKADFLNEQGTKVLLLVPLNL
jgi:signal transduction histidine kinase